MSTLFLIFGAFATFRISDILVAKDGSRGPWDIIYKFHKFIGIGWDASMDIPSVYPDRFLPQLFSCIGCMSVWVGLVIMLIYLYLPAIVFLLFVMPFSLSGVAVLIDSLRYKG